MNTIETNTGIQLIQAARHGDVDLVRNLLAQGSSAKTHDKDGWTALMRAAHLGHTEIVKILLPVSDSREYVYDIGQSDMTALDWAVAYGHTEAAKALLSVSDVDAIEEAVDIADRYYGGHRSETCAFLKGYVQSLREKAELMEATEPPIPNSLSNASNLPHRSPSL